MLLNTISLLLIHCTLLGASGASTLQNKGGITGYVRILKGNQMPMTGHHQQQAGKGIVSEICIFKATPITATEGTAPLFTKINTQLIATVKTDSSGHYMVYLLPGKYSLFVKQAGGFFAGETDGGYLTPVEISGHTLVRKDINITSGAAF